MGPDIKGKVNFNLISLLHKIKFEIEQTMEPALNGLNFGPAKKSKVETTTAPMPRATTIDR